jgi:hypothetical protein
MIIGLKICSFPLLWEALEDDYRIPCNNKNLNIFNNYAYLINSGACFSVFGCAHSPLYIRVYSLSHSYRFLNVTDSLSVSQRLRFKMSRYTNGGHLTPIFTANIIDIISPKLCSPHNFNSHII